MARETLEGQNRIRSFRSLLLVGMAMAVGLVAFLLYSSYHDSLRSAEVSGRNLASIIETRLDATLRRATTVLQALRRELPLDSMQPENAPRYRERFDNELEARAAHFPELTGLRIFDAQGSLLYANGRNGFKGQAHVDDREFFRRLRDDPALDHAFSEAFLVRSTGTNSFGLAYAVRDREGRFLGIVLALINLDYFQGLLEKLDVGPNGVIAIRRSDNFTLMLRQPRLPEEINKALFVGNPTRQAVLAGKRDVVVRYAAQTDGIERIFAVRTLEAFPFYVLVALADDDALANWYWRVSFIGLAALMLVSLLIATYRRLVFSGQREQVAIADLETSERRFRSLFDEAPVGYALNRLDDGRFVEINIAFAELTGYGREDLNKLSYWDLTPRTYEAEEARQLETLRSTGRYGPYEKEYVRKDGKPVPVRLTGTLYDGEGGDRMILSVVEDMSERKRAEDELRLMASIFDHSGEAILVTDRANRIVAVNGAFTRLTGYSDTEVIGRNPNILSSGRTTREEYDAMWRAITDAGYWQGEVWDRRRDGSVYPKWLTISTLKSAEGRVTHYIGNFTDISERKAAEEQIRHLAHHDTLTGLPNRFHLQGRLEQALAAARRGGGRLAVMFLDLDRFKIINDTLGHHVGDGLLKEVGRRLADSVRDSDIVARLGGDEFVVVQTDVEAAGAARQVAEKVLNAVGAPYDIEGNELHTTPSIGIALFPDDGDSVEALMKNADAAMYHAKTAGRNNVQFFAAHMNADVAERLALESSLRQAVERGGFELHYQPQIELATGRVVGVEALARWRHPELGLVPPDRFIPLAEETGLIVPLGAWVINEAARQLALWRKEGIAGIGVAVNLSAYQLRDPALPGSVADVLARHGLAARDIEIEITESVAMNDPRMTIEHLNSLRQMGVELAVDDFGTGYSSLAYLKLLPIHRLKLDRSFVRDIENDANDAAICAATIALAHSLSLSVIAEGVENAAQRDYLARLDCDMAQGYLFSRPLPAAEAGEFLRRAAAGAAN